MQKVTVNGLIYFGKLKNKKGVLTLTESMLIKKVNKQSISEYLKCKNLGTLQTETFAGKGLAWSISKLTNEQQMECDMCKLAMRQAKRIAAAGTENNVFDGILGNL